MSEHTVVTHGDVASLPALARIAIAARWARRCSFLVCAWGSNVDDESAIERLVRAAEDVGSGYRPDLDADELRAAESTVDKRAEFEYDTEIYPAGHAGRAVVSAFRAALAQESTESVRLVAHTLNEASFAIRRFTDTHDLVYPARPDIRSDFELLLNCSRDERWHDNTPVRPEVFSPDASVERRIVFAVNDLCVALCTLIAEHAPSLKYIEWRQREQVVATALDGLGFTVELTPEAKDGGKDIVATCTIRGALQTYYVELKHWRSGKRPGVQQIRHFVQINLRDNTQGGLFLSTSGYTAAVVEQLAQITQQRIRLGTDVTVVSLCQRFVRERGSAVWHSVDVLPAVILGTENATDSLARRSGGTGGA